MTNESKEQYIIAWIGHKIDVRKDESTREVSKAILDGDYTLDDVTHFMITDNNKKQLYYKKYKEN